MKKNKTFRSAGHQGAVTLCEGKFIRMVAKNGWEYVERSNCTGIVVVLAMTARREVLFTEQFRVPVDTRVIEFPAGLVNDRPGEPHERLEEAATRELAEETGYLARKMEILTEGPVSSGLSSETITFLRASDLKKVGAGGGDKTEAIRVHRVPLADADRWLRKKQERGCLVDPKVYAGMYFLMGRR